MLTSSYPRLHLLLTRFAVIVAVLVAISLPVGYGGAVINDFLEYLDFKGQMKVIAVEALIVDRPDTWMLADKRVKEALLRRPGLDPGEYVRVLDEQGEVVSEAGLPPDYPIWTKRFELHDVAHIAGQLEIHVSLRPVLLKVSLACLYGLALGLLVFMVLRTLPLRALNRVLIALHTEKERAETTLGAIGDAVVTTDAAGRVDYLNPMAQSILGVPLAVVRGQPLAEVIRLVDAITGEPLESSLSRALAEQHVVSCKGNSELCRADLSRLAVEERAAPIYDQEGRVIGGVMVLRDVSLSRELNRRRSWEATHDPLTEIYNRREFENRVRLALADTQAEGRMYVVCYMDLDGFKVVNDTCGHSAGDRLLIQLAQLIRTRIRESDTLARLGGDEFGVLLDGCDIDKARVIAADLIAAVEEYIFVSDGKRFSVGVSVGLTQISADHAGLNEIMGEADCACYWAKEQGRNRACIFRASDMNLAARRSETGWVPQINAAFEEGRFQLYFQEYLALNGEGSRQHIEVLLRMLGRTGEVIAPGRFLPAAERFNLIVDIDRWVVQSVFSAYPRLVAERAGRPLTCCINLSGASLNTPGFLDFLRGQVHTHRLEPGAICFELTETVAVHDIQAAADFIRACKAFGILFALDDFGTGSSSFGYLKRLPVDFLKIDGSFVREIEHDRIDRR